MQILREGGNCWRAPHAGRVAVLIDGEAYFAALADAIERAERSILMIGWDFHSRVCLRRHEEGGDESTQLVALLERQVRRKRRLRVRILAWDFPVLYALEREWLPLYHFDLSTHRRIRLCLDGCHPLGASQHQKIVVIDDALAFGGGLDVTTCRWDTREHRARDPRRCDPGAADYGPFHDVQMAVDGDAARALAELARERWRLATGRRLRRVRGPRDPWPPSLSPRFRDVRVAIARTRPAFEEQGEVREVEALYVDAIRAAKGCLYLENQYLTSQVVGDALAARLAEPDGPEVVIVLPASLSGWLEESTMGILSRRIGRQLRKADRFGRLRLLRPRLPGEARLTVHAKLSVFDDRLLRVGSANLSNRSMGLDSECDLAIEATPERDVRTAIRELRDELVAEHLGVSAEEVTRCVAREGSLRAAIDALAQGERSLVPLELESEVWVDELVSDGAVFDPERPIAFEALWSAFTAGRETTRARARAPSSPVVRVAVVGAVALALAAAWTLGPFQERISPEALARSMAELARTPGGGVLAVALFASAATLLVPVTALIAACGALFGAVKGTLIALAGSVLGAALGYAAGRVLWRDAVRRLCGARLDAISRRLAQRGVVGSAALRLVPVAPFGLVNLVAGATHLRPRDFLLGTALGMGPGALALALLGERAFDALREPGPVTIALAAALALGVAFGAWFVARHLDPARDESED